MHRTVSFSTACIFLLQGGNVRGVWGLRRAKRLGGHQSVTLVGLVSHTVSNVFTGEPILFAETGHEMNPGDGRSSTRQTTMVIHTPSRTIVWFLATLMGGHTQETSELSSLTPLEQNAFRCPTLLALPPAIALQSLADSARSRSYYVHACMCVVASSSCPQFVAY